MYVRQEDKSLLSLSFKIFVSLSYWIWIQGHSFLFTMLFMYFFGAFMTFQSGLNFAEIKKKKQSQTLKSQIKQTPKYPNLQTTNSTQNHPKTKQNSEQKILFPTEQNRTKPRPTCLPA